MGLFTRGRRRIGCDRFAGHALARVELAECAFLNGNARCCRAPRPTASRRASSCCRRRHVDFLSLVARHARLIDDAQIARVDEADEVQRFLQRLARRPHRIGGRRPDVFAGWTWHGACALGPWAVRQTPSGCARAACAVPRLVCVAAVAIDAANLLFDARASTAVRLWHVRQPFALLRAISAARSAVWPGCGPVPAAAGLPRAAAPEHAHDRAALHRSGLHGSHRPTSSPTSAARIRGARRGALVQLADEEHLALSGSTYRRLSVRQGEHRERRNRMSLVKICLNPGRA